MYLERLELKNFRSFANATIPLDKDLTVLVGENNGGKSNVIEAIRLLTLPASGRIDRYCELDDLHRHTNETAFTISGSFSGLSPSQQGNLLSLASDQSVTKARLTLSCEIEGPQVKRPRFTGGAHDGQPEQGTRDLIRHVYLPALRDAQYALSSGNPTRKLALLRHVIPEGDHDAFRNALQRSGTHAGLGQVRQAVSKELADLTSGVREQAAELGFSDSEQLIDIARDLRFKLGDADGDANEIALSGLGFANLLYMATIIVELERAQEADLTLFLVEEPEAHLHPQLQMSVLDFLRDRAQKRPEVAPGVPEGRIQVVVASHSPNLTSWVSSSNLIGLRTVAAENGKQSKPLPLNKIELSSKERRKIDRYLDVMRASLLFGGRCLLAEGIAEAILLPVIADQLFKDQIAAADASAATNEEKVAQTQAIRAKQKKFRGSTFIPIDGVDFSPYIKMMLSDVDGVRLADRVVVLTDEDNGAGTNRKTNFEALADRLSASDKLTVIVGTDTLEVDLYAAGNAAIMKAAYLTLHPRSEDKWNAIADVEGDERAQRIREVFDTTRKGDFAQELAAQIEDEDSELTFTPPDYLVRAIEAACQ
ncbi:ATP-dependent nuclease [Maricaulis sp. D1M11]|uniref:ATP-dependent nuclease n=1 Tax=Maricaulis sp. D1M11 TaxID=3076117 RepID=UPI0039B63415